MEAGIQLGCYLRDYQAKALRGRTILELGSGIGGWCTGLGVQGVGGCDVLEGNALADLGIGTGWQPLQHEGQWRVHERGSWRQHSSIMP